MSATISKEEFDEIVLLKNGKPCCDYPKVKQMSVQCQNCRFNRFVGGNISQQKCMPHTHADARRKEAPGAAPADYLEKWMKNVEKHRLERDIAKYGKLAEDVEEGVVKEA